ncbi:MAG: peptide/nickel transport system ATP-binding protein [Thermotogaceae bacterium]|jgi:oligopeptide/dipeptide ABC transporter ATP-binding protein|nr:peptide/nickel transport system ATP-binding protein [Thermotogaceae bacterium]
MERILEVKDLKIQFDTEEGTVYALENVSFHLNKGEILGIIGETGSGKSVTASAINRILPVPPARIVNGEIIFQGKDVLQYKREEMNRIRGKKISMIFQEPMTALNPVFKIKEQMSDVIMHHQKINRKKAVKQATEMLEQVRIPDPEMVLDKYPHELSGGMRQRVMIATALSCEADLLIADEPTTALDVTTQDQILALIQDMRKNLDISVILITHDFGVVAEICDTVAVMYGGSVVEFTDIYTLTKKPYHPYSNGLLKAIPPVDQTIEKLNTIPGSVPNLLKPPPGCRFHPRCENALEKCKIDPPSLTEIEENHFIACYNPIKGGEDNE